MSTDASARVRADSAKNGRQRRSVSIRACHGRAARVCRDDLHGVRRERVRGRRVGARATRDRRLRVFVVCFGSRDALRPTVPASSAQAAAGSGVERVMQSWLRTNARCTVVSPRCRRLLPAITTTWTHIHIDADTLGCSTLRTPQSCRRRPRRSRTTRSVRPRWTPRSRRACPGWTARPFAVSLPFSLCYLRVVAAPTRLSPPRVGFDVSAFCVRRGGQVLKATDGDA